LFYLISLQSNQFIVESTTLTMRAIIQNMKTKLLLSKYGIALGIIVTLLSFHPPISFSQETNLSNNPSPNKSLSSGIIYRNPRVYNVDYTFELCPEKDKIDPSKDLKLWIPVPREWDSQKAVKIISVEPEPHAKYEDPEHGNKIYYWDFGKVPAKDTYEVKIRYRAEVFEVYSDIDPEKIGPYEIKSKEYQLYTRSTYSTNINSEIMELTHKAIGNETNPYLQAKLIFEFVRRNMHFNIDVRREIGSSIENMLKFKVTDPKTGEQYFEGQCDHYSILFVTLCRAAGIPARGVIGMVGWGPWIKEKDLVLRDTRYTLLTSDGLAATRIYGHMDGHIWAEFYLPSYGWIPADPTWGTFGYQSNNKLILSKGRDVKIGPNVPQDNGEEYGDQWIPLHEGRVNAIGWGVWNITKIRVAKAKVLHNSDPFPADGYAEYAANLYPESDKEEKLRNWRKEQTLLFYNTTKKSPNAGNIFEIKPRLNANREAYICHLLRQIAGDEKFRKIFQTWLDLRLTSGNPVSTERFREIAEKVYGASLDFIFKEWVANKSLPQFRLDNVMIEKRENDWRVQGSILQEGETYYHVPIDLVLETEKGQESQKILLDSDKKDFAFYLKFQPEKLIVDPDFHIPTIRWMPPRLQMLWDSYPDLIVIYGGLAEAESNRAAAERFNKEFLGLDPGIIKADTNVTADDLKKMSIVLFGRPETNKITQQFRESFPVRFERNSFTWQGTTYDRPAQGVAQIIENPLDPQGLIILYAGLSGDATQEICDKTEWQKELDGQLLIDANFSYIIYENHTKLASGDWEDLNSTLVWTFK
jgi:transglutaminase-like putative cysteine protease